MFYVMLRPWLAAFLTVFLCGFLRYIKPVLADHSIGAVFLCVAGTVRIYAAFREVHMLRVTAGAAVVGGGGHIFKVSVSVSLAGL